MLALPSVDIDSEQFYAAARLPIVCERAVAPDYGHTVLPTTAVRVAGSVYLQIGHTSPLRTLTEAERAAMDRAFWKSVVVLDQGFE